MSKYLVNYMIPEEHPSEDGELSAMMLKVLRETFEEIGDEITESRSADYAETYKKLDAIGYRLMTSCYLVEFEGTARDVIGYVLEGLTTNLRSRIKLLVTEISKNRALYNLGVR